MSSDFFDRLRIALADRYAITRELGQGGMATVYLAEDLKHHRQVAIKVLKPELAAVLGAERFLREIEIAARLNHPHILPLHDSGEAGGFLYYVMPFVEGESLRTKLAREGELPIPTAVRILRDVVDALAAAHRNGVVHRDIKPDNVLLFDNHAVVTDFGVAKAVSEATGRQQLTTAGVALGTPAYMSPEQAVADPHTDHRADIYAVGAMGYELLTGRPPFTGLSAQEVLAAHVTEAPEPVTRRRATVPPPLAEALMRCLAKRPADRWQSADELLHELEALATPSGGTAPTMSHVVPPRRRAWGTAVVAVGAIGLASALGGVWLSRRETPAVVFGRSEQVTAETGLEIQPAISPDGRFVAYAAGSPDRRRIFIRPVSGRRTIPLSDDSTAVESWPRWSPDGNQVLFLTGGGVAVAAALGPTVRPVVPSSASGPVLSAAWSPDGREMLFVRVDSVYVGPVEGGAPRLVGTATDMHSCRWSPDGRWIACVQGNIGYAGGNLGPSRIVLLPPAGGAASPVTDADVSHQSPEWSPDGRHLLFVSDHDGPRDVYAQEITSSGKPSGSPVRITTGLNVQSMSMSGDGRRIAYNVYSARRNIWSLPIPRGAPVTVEAATAATAGATAVTTGNQVIEALRVSRDGRWLVYDSNLRGNADIYRISVDGGQAEQLTTEPFDEFGPDLSPDGLELAYYSLRTGNRDIEVKRLDGSPVERVTATPRSEMYPVWAPDGRGLAFDVRTAAGGAGTEPRVVVVTFRIQGSGWTPVDTVGRGTRAAWSPDGRAIAYPESRGVGSAIVVYSLESQSSRVVYRPTGSEPAVDLVEWAADNRTIYFRGTAAGGGTGIWAVTEGDRPRLLVRFPDPDVLSTRGFATDGKRFYFTLGDRESDVFVVEVVGGR